MKRLDYCWYTPSPWPVFLVPLSLIYCLVVRLRRLLYRVGVLASHRLPVPVVIVGNLTAGGTGKTPLVAWLAGFLRTAGYRPGIVARGYRGRARHWPQRVCPDSDPRMVGDEAVLLADLCGCPVAVAPRRVAAARSLLEQGDCDLILADDGLQHYALQRDVEIAVVDGIRRLGNGLCLPAGPLREPPARLDTVDLVVVNGQAGRGEYTMKMKAATACRLHDRNDCRALESFRNRSVHAVAGTGNPGRFFDALRQAGMRIAEHAFSDHHAYTADELDFDDALPVFMTAKDAVKCRNFSLQDAWCVPVTMEIDAQFSARILELLGRVASARGMAEAQNSC
jgi:tetraacyldisaccharide 4'-kinase